MDVYLHVRVLLGMILALALGHLLRGLALIIQHPKKYRVYWIHLLWALFLYIYLIHFWWWEFNLVKVEQWTFPLYFFIAIYATLLYFLCTLLFPEQISEYDGFKNYFYARKNWFFATMILLFLADVFDTIIKGGAYRRHTLGMAYDLRAVSYIVFSLIAIKVNKQSFQAFFVLFALAYEVLYILTYFLTVS